MVLIRLFVFAFLDENNFSVAIHNKYKGEVNIPFFFVNKAEGRMGLL